MNKMWERYKQTSDFSEFYASISGTWKHRVYRESKRMKVPEHDLLEAYDAALLDVMEVESVDNFKSLFNTSVYRRKLRIIEYYKKECRDIRRTCYESELSYDDGEGDEKGFDFIDDYRVDDEVIVRTQKEREQLQLLSILYHRSDEVTKRMIEAARTLDEVNANTLCKALGVTHKVIVKRLRDLRKTFEQGNYGNHYDYLSA